jgi:hypothetical protein
MAMSAEPDFRSIKDDDGSKWRIQRLERGVWLTVRDIPSLAVAFEDEKDARRAIKTYLNR